MRVTRRVGFAGAAIALLVSTSASADPGVVSVLDAPPLSTATYLIKAARLDDATAPPFYTVALERGTYHCAALLDALAPGYPAPTALEAARKTCDLGVGIALAHQVREGESVLFAVDAKGTWLNGSYAILAAAQPIDSPAKALLAVWLDGHYPNTWSAEGHADASRVHAVDGGFELATSIDDTTGCTKRDPRWTTTRSELTLFVDATGELKERKKTPGARTTQACPPAARSRR